MLVKEIRDLMTWDLGLGTRRKTAEARFRAANIRITWME
jgi:hypothetical protein